MRINLHTHTYHCGHAQGAIEDYIKRAVLGGITEMGFSEHIPFRFPDGYESGYRMPTKEVLLYMKEIKELSQKYRADIRIHVGFEMEYYPLYFDEMLQNARSWGAEYLILGQHFIGNEYPSGYYSGKSTEDEDKLSAYTDTVIEGMKTGVFTYLAHPDLFHFTGDSAVYASYMRRLCAAAKALSIPIEINFLGIRDHRHYPNSTFWEIAGEEDAPVVFGFDAHTAESACDLASLPDALALVEKNKLSLIEPVLRRI